MIDPDAFAVLLCDWCLEPRPGHQVLIVGSTLAQAPAAALQREVLEREAWPLVHLVPPQAEEQFYRHARDSQLDGFAPLELTEVQSADAWLRIDAPANTRAVSGVDPALLARAARARAPVRDQRLKLRWCATLWPTPALAQEADMAEREYELLVNSALFLNRPDPVSAWRELAEHQQRMVERLADAHEVRIQADGTDLRLRVDGRRWINSDGRRNMPSGEVFTGPQEDSAQGTIRFTVPSSRQGALVEDVELKFEAGEVISARAGRGEDHLRAALQIDAGSRRLGELGIGTNGGITRVTGSTLLDEKMAGTVHLALGRSYPETGGKNGSALHWDLVCDLRSRGSLTVDGEELELFSEV